MVPYCREEGIALTAEETDELEKAADSLKLNGIRF